MSKITKSAKGKACMVRIPNVCNFDAETTVFAHRNGGGMGCKAPDFIGAYACSACHDAVDGRMKTEFTLAERNTMLFEGIFRTQELLYKQGLITTEKNKGIK